MLAAALNCATADEVAGLLRQASAQATVPLFAPELVLTGQTALTREEAVKLATDRLYVLGRTDDSRGLEQVVLNREKNCSTGFGFGFAIPPGQTDALRSDSLVLVKLNSPVSWNALDGQPVRADQVVFTCDSIREYLDLLGKTKGAIGLGPLSTTKSSKVWSPEQAPKLVRPFTLLVSDQLPEPLGKAVAEVYAAIKRLK